MKTIKCYVFAPKHSIEELLTYIYRMHISEYESKDFRIHFEDVSDRERTVTVTLYDVEED